MASYVLPQVKIFQQFRQISRDVVGNLNACIIGPHYQLARYNEADEKELTKLGVLYSGELMDSAYPYHAKNVDTGYVRVFFEDVVAKYADLDNAYLFSDVVYNNYFKTVDFLGSFGAQVFGDAFDPADFMVTELASGDSIYFVPCVGDPVFGEFIDVDNYPLNEKTVAVVYKSAVTGECRYLTSEELSKLRILKPSIDDFMHVDVSAFRVLWVIDSLDFDEFLSDASDSAWRDTSNAPYTGLVDCIRLRPEVLVEYIDKIRSNKALRGKVKFVVYSDVLATDVSIDKTDFGVSVVLPIHTSSQYRDVVAANSEFTNIFESYHDDNEDWDQEHSDFLVRPQYGAGAGDYVSCMKKFDNGEIAVLLTDGYSSFDKDNGTDQKCDALFVSYGGGSNFRSFDLQIPGTLDYHTFAIDHGINGIYAFQNRNNRELRVIVYNDSGKRLHTKTFSLNSQDGIFCSATVASSDYHECICVLQQKAMTLIPVAVNTNNIFSYSAIRLAAPNNVTFMVPSGNRGGWLDDTPISRHVLSNLLFGNKFYFVAVGANAENLYWCNIVRGATTTESSIDVVPIHFEGAGEPALTMFDNSFQRIYAIATSEQSTYLTIVACDCDSLNSPVMLIPLMPGSVSGTVGLVVSPHHYSFKNSRFRYYTLFSGDFIIVDGVVYNISYFDSGAVRNITRFGDQTSVIAESFGRGAVALDVGTVKDLGVVVGDRFLFGNGLGAAVMSLSFADSVSHISKPYVPATSVGWSSGNQLIEKEFSVQGTYTGKVNTTYTLEIVDVSQGEPSSFEDGSVITFRVSDSAGIDSIHEIEVDWYSRDYIPVSDNYGVALVHDNTYDALFTTALRSGMKICVDCTAAKRSFVNGFRLVSYSGFGSSDPEFAQLIPSAGLAKAYGAVAIPEKTKDGGTNWMATEEGIIFSAGIEIEAEDGRILTVDSAKPYVEYRALQTRYADTIHEVSSPNDVMTLLGSVSIDNPLAQGCYHAVLNSGDQPVFFIAVNKDNQAGYANALERLETVNNIYSLAPMTLDDAVLDDIQAHVNSMSGPEAKLWRISVVGVNADQTIAVYNNTKHPLDGEYDATVVGDLVTFKEEDETVATNDILAGDLFRYNFRADPATDVILYDTRTVDHVIDNRHIMLVPKDEDDIYEGDVDVVDNVTTFAKCEVWRNLTSAQWIEYMANKISAFADRRMYAVFPPVLWNDGKKYPGYIGAAAIAGLISSVPPQQGLTRITLNGFDDIPMVYSGYTRAQLNNIAAHGGLIIAQDVPGGPVYVRHQVSTAASDGNLLTTELSVTKDLDAISYYFDSVLEPFYGKYNITPVFLEQLTTTVTGAMNYLGSYNTGSGLLGPMLLIDSEDTKINGIRQHETLKDHVVISLSLDLPLPCNVIELYLSV